MNQIVWKDSYKIGVDFIDKEHKQLFSTMNKLLKISESEEKSEWACREGVKYLRNHTTKHFEHEEEYMKSINYSEYEIHKRLHDNFRKYTLPALEAEMEMNEYSEDSVRHFLGVCIGWVVGHTQTEDQAIAGKTMSKWMDIPHEEEKDALEAAVIQLVKEIFHLEAQMISEQYAGEDFGKVVCCRFLYHGEKKEKWEVTLVFEDRLLLKVIRGILNAEYPRVDDMVLNVTRYLSRQFLERLRESFPSIDLMNLEKESLLTHEQLVNSFERSQPSCSLLFDTGEGYFAFCVAAGDSVRGKIASVVNPDNAMNAIKKYLAKGNKKEPETAEPLQRKKKILVVDDSEFMLARMVKMLSESYELIEATSSVSAIKKIAVNRPDLVILDYEMPVCDGRQALEMIRSDKDIADIPVIFLTGKGDRESVKNVMSLKPEGYLLKSMPDEDIKKNIDGFFAKSKS